ncbi:MAG: GntR family transcriptional regulator [Treponema sp.]|nr:GntR family transcriptional regulator [Treponema sp.]
MDITLSQKSENPIYTQIYEQVSNQILKGELKPGTRLPPIRSVAVDLRVSIIPIKQAWDMLEREGFITTAVGRGTFVSDLKTHEIEEKRSTTAEELLAKDIKVCKEMGLTVEEIIEIVRKNFEA